jgi:hypothetical protein
MSTPPLPGWALPAWAPAISDVAALERARTKDPNGNELGIFDATTRPTDTDVEPLIRNACADVASYVGWDLPDDLQAEACNLATIYTALQIEESYYPEQVANGRSPWQQLWQRYQLGIKELADAAADYAGMDASLAATQGSVLVTSPTMASRLGLGWPWWGTETLSPGVGSYPDQAQPRRSQGSARLRLRRQRQR